MALDRIDIPASAYEVKAVFSDPPDLATIADILAHVALTGKPETYRLHTHTKPKKGGRIVYVGEFDVPTFGRKVSSVAPCPCCWPDTAKYKNGGKIAWFPDEQVIRLIGPDCYRSLDKEGHEQAEREFRERQRREKHIRYLVRQFPQLQELAEVCFETARIAHEFEEFRDLFRRRVSGTLQMDLWDHVRTGSVYRHVERRELRTSSRGGTEHLATINATERVMSVRGASILNPRSIRLAPGLLAKSRGLVELIAKLGSVSSVSSANDIQLRKAASDLQAAWKAVHDVQDRVASERSFIAQDQVTALGIWGQMAGATYPMIFERNGWDLTIGYNRQDCVRLSIPKLAEEAMPAVPPELGTD